MKKRILRPLPGMDLPFLILVLTLVGFGLVMLASASSAVALYRRGDAWAYLRPQLLYAALGLCGMWLASRVDYHIFHKLAWPLLGLSLILLAAVLFMPEYNGCRRWLVIPGFGTLQPSEIAKFAVVLVFSHIIALNHDRMKDFSVGVLPFALVLGVVAALMLLEPHLSGTVLILGIGAVLMFVGGTGLRWFLLAGAGGVGAIGAAVAVMPDLVPYAADRLRSWLDPFADPLGDGHQTIQSLYAIGSGGATGLGLGESRQKHLFVPEPQNDFIFSIVCEELGFVGACAVVGLFVLLLCRGITIAAHAPDRFGALLVVGFVVQVALQAVLNVAVVTNTIPNTGISLPFFSSGGTSLMMLLGEMGVVLGVSRGSRTYLRQRRKQGGEARAAASRMRATAKQTLGAATRAVASLAMTERARPQKNGRCTAIGSGLCQSKTIIALPCSISASLPSQALTRQLSQRESLFKMRFPCWKPPAPLLRLPRR